MGPPTFSNLWINPSSGKSFILFHCTQNHGVVYGEIGDSEGDGGSEKTGEEPPCAVAGSARFEGQGPVQGIDTLYPEPKVACAGRLLSRAPVSGTCYNGYMVQKLIRIPLWAAIVLVIFHISPAIGAGKTARDGFRISSTAFRDNGSIPSKYTCDGKDVNPPLIMENVPEKARSLVLIVDDPDAPAGIWVHWVVWNIAPRTRSIKENSTPEGVSRPSAEVGLNDFRKRSYGGPCPPSGTHRYFFKLYALDAALNLPAGSKKQDVERAMRGHVIARTQVMGLYKSRK